MQLFVVLILQILLLLWVNTDNRINYGPALENIVYVYALTKDYSVSIGRVGKPECDLILRDFQQQYA